MFITGVTCFMDDAHQSFNEIIFIIARGHSNIFRYSPTKRMRTDINTTSCKIKAKFEEINFIGPNYVADFLEISNAEERDIVKRETFELVNTLMEKFGIEPFKEI